MAVKFLEPGGDATFNVATTTNGGFWGNTATGTLATDFVHGSHLKSIKYAPNTSNQVLTFGLYVVQDSGTRISLYVYFNALPTSATAAFLNTYDSGNNLLVAVRLTTGGILQMWKGSGSNTYTSQIGSNGATLSTGVWYRICLAYTITSSSVNRFELFVDGVSSISITNATLGSTSEWIKIGNSQTNGGMDFRTSDHYIDDSNSLTDTGNIWVTAKRPNANGTFQDFTTQVGSGGSGYGSGTSPQVNERALSTTNGWNVFTPAAAKEQTYNIEGKSVGDIDISAATIIDSQAWAYIQRDSAPQTGNIVLNGVSTSAVFSSSSTMRLSAFAGSSTYPAGTGTDVGVITDSSTYGSDYLYECGIIVAYIPSSGSSQNSNFFQFM